MSETVSVGAALPGEGFAEAAAMIFKFGDDLTNILNSPQMLALRQNQDVQALLNQETKDVIAAHESGNLATVNAESAG